MPSLAATAHRRVKSGSSSRTSTRCGTRTSRTLPPPNRGPSFPSRAAVAFRFRRFAIAAAARPRRAPWRKRPVAAARSQHPPQAGGAQAGVQILPRRRTLKNGTRSTRAPKARPSSFSPRAEDGRRWSTSRWKSARDHGGETDDPSKRVARSQAIRRAKAYKPRMPTAPTACSVDSALYTTTLCSGTLSIGRGRAEIRFVPTACAPNDSNATNANLRRMNRSPSRRGFPALQGQDARGRPRRHRRDNRVRADTRSPTIPSLADSIPEKASSPDTNRLHVGDGPSSVRAPVLREHLETGKKLGDEANASVTDPRVLGARSSQP